MPDHLFAMDGSTGNYVAGFQLAIVLGISVVLSVFLETLVLEDIDTMPQLETLGKDAGGKETELDDDLVQPGPEEEHGMDEEVKRLTCQTRS